MGNIMTYAQLATLVLRGVLLAHQAFSGRGKGENKKALATNLASTVIDGIAAGGNDEARDNAVVLKAQLSDAIESTVSVLKEHGLLSGPDK